MNTKDWDVFDILFAHEDSYTNLLQYLFENSSEFYKNFSKLLFGEEKSNLKFVTRTSYDLGQGKRNVPDIIVYNTDSFAMIEVKVHSGEGDNQTQRYFDCKELIKEKLEISPNAINKFYFLTLLGNKAECTEFESMSWLKIGECLPDKSFENEEIELLVKHFKRRIDTLKPINIDINDKWCDVVKTKYWGGARGMFDSLKEVPSFRELPDELCDYWDSFKQSKNTFTYSSLFLLNKSWRGSTVTETTNDYKNCYELHFEFDWDEQNSVLEMRLDYHLNPYLSNKDIERSEGAIRQYALEANKFRCSVAKNAKSKWKQYAPAGLEECYNARLTNNIMKLISYSVKVEEDIKISQIVTQVHTFVEAASAFAENEILPYHK